MDDRKKQVAIDANLHAELKVQAAEERIPVGELVERLIKRGKAAEEKQQELKW